MAKETLKRKDATFKASTRSGKINRAKPKVQKVKKKKNPPKRKTPPKKPKPYVIPTTISALDKALKDSWELPGKPGLTIAKRKAELDRLADDGKANTTGFLKELITLEASDRTPNKTHWRPYNTIHVKANLTDAEIFLNPKRKPFPLPPAPDPHKKDIRIYKHYSNNQKQFPDLLLVNISGSGEGEKDNTLLNDDPISRSLLKASSLTKAGKYVHTSYPDLFTKALAEQLYYGYTDTFTSGGWIHHVNHKTLDNTLGNLTLVAARQNARLRFKPYHKKMEQNFKKYIQKQGYAAHSLLTL